MINGHAVWSHTTDRAGRDTTRSSCTDSGLGRVPSFSTGGDIYIGAARCEGEHAPPPSAGCVPPGVPPALVPVLGRWRRFRSGRHAMRCPVWKRALYGGVGLRAIPAVRAAVGAPALDLHSPCGAGKVIVLRVGARPRPGYQVLPRVVAASLSKEAAGSVLPRAPCRDPTQRRSAAGAPALWATELALLRAWGERVAPCRPVAVPCVQPAHAYAIG